ncbi:MAG: nucleotide exchange factor GrpE [Myxococcota bacterium]
METRKGNNGTGGDSVDENGHELEEERPRIIVNDRRHWAKDDEDSEEDEAPRKPTYVAELEEKLAAQEQLVVDIRQQAKEARDEFEQARVRLQRETQAEVKRGVRRTLAALLDVLDNLDRAVEAIGKGTDITAGNATLTLPDAELDAYRAKAQDHETKRTAGQ